MFATAPRRMGIVIAVALAASFAPLGASGPAALALPCRACHGHSDPPPPPLPAPTVSIDLARQAPDRGSIHVSGWTAEANAPTTPLTVLISVDGGSATGVTANVSRPDVAAKYPTYGPNHGYDFTMPASAAAKKICITAVHVGTGQDTSVCRRVDSVVAFNANAIAYDTSRAQIAGSSIDELDKVNNTNSTMVQQSTTISGQRQLTDARGWSDTYGVKVTVSTSLKVDVPLLAEGKIGVSAEGSASFVQNGTTTSQATFGWQQPVLVPAKSIVVADVTVTRTTLVVPYAMSGSVLYASGAQAPYSIDGTYSGVNSHDLQVTLTQYNLDGTPAAVSIAQPEATRLQQT